jgi:HNH endonuclease
VSEYACHYCGRGEGSRTKDHKVPKLLGGSGQVENLVLCCKMCNSIKGSRLYEWFVPLFQNFLDLHGEEYRSANPDDWATIGAMNRRFNRWLNALNHAERVTAGS